LQAGGTAPARGVHATRYATSGREYVAASYQPAEIVLMERFSAGIFIWKDWEMDIDADVIGTGPNVAFMPMAQAEKLIEENEHLRACFDMLIAERDVLQESAAYWQEQYEKLMKVYPERTCHITAFGLPLSDFPIGKCSNCGCSANVSSKY
jgi:hypothetical protein